MSAKQLSHTARGEVDVEMAVALGLPITAICGKRWVPTKYGKSELAGIPECPTCMPAPKRRKLPKRQAGRTDPKPHYVYRCYDATGALLYVGCTNNPVARLAQHRKSSWWFERTATTRLLVFPNRLYALDRERQAIAEEMPLCNVKGRWQHRGDHWTADDYMTFRSAVINAIESTHGVYGTNTTKMLADLDAELLARFGITAMKRRRPA